MLGHYRIIDKLSAGGMGEVYLAEDTRLQRQVAIKLLPPPLAQDPERLARLEREARILAAVNHPNIASIYGLEEADSVRYLVLELVPGKTLAEHLRRGGLPTEEALSICRQIATGLEAAHEKGVVHRDLKPANGDGDSGGRGQDPGFWHFIGGIAGLADRGAKIQADFIKTNDVETLKKKRLEWATDAITFLNAQVDPSYAIQFNNAHGSAMMGCPVNRSADGCGYWQDIQGKKEALMSALTEMRQRR